MKRNTDPNFAGIVALREKQHKQLEKFEQSAADADWLAIHHDHYDWWMFPTDEPSSYGFMWTVYEGDVAELKQDSEYVARYLKGVELLARAWGWDLRLAQYIPDPQPDQCWQHWPIRLYKAGRSVKLFGFSAEFASLRSLAVDLMSKGESMYYNRDLSWIFRD